MFQFWVSSGSILGLRIIHTYPLIKILPVPKNSVSLHPVWSPQKQADIELITHHINLLGVKREQCENHRQSRCCKFHTRQSPDDHCLPPQANGKVRIAGTKSEDLPIHTQLKLSRKGR